MTCAACAARVEKKLAQLQGVAATVNYATGTALVTAPAALPVQELTAAVAQAGLRRHRARRRRRAEDDADGRTSRLPPGTSPTCAVG